MPPDRDMANGTEFLHRISISVMSGLGSPEEAGRYWTLEVHRSHEARISTQRRLRRESSISTAQRLERRAQLARIRYLEKGKEMTIGWRGEDPWMNYCPLLLFQFVTASGFRIQERVAE